MADRVWVLDQSDEANTPTINLMHVYISAGRDRTVDDGMRLDKGISKQLRTRR